MTLALAITARLGFMPHCSAVAIAWLHKPPLQKYAARTHPAAGLTLSALTDECSHTHTCTHPLCMTIQLHSPPIQLSPCLSFLSFSPTLLPQFHSDLWHPLSPRLSDALCAALAPLRTHKAPSLYTTCMHLQQRSCDITPGTVRSSARGRRVVVGSAARRVQGDIEQAKMRDMREV